MALLEINLCQCFCHDLVHDVTIDKIILSKLEDNPKKKVREVLTQC